MRTLSLELRASALLIIACIVGPFWPSPAHTSWLPASRLTDTPGEASVSGNNAQCIAGDQSGNLHLVWYKDHITDSEIGYMRFNGVMWSPETTLISMSPAAVDPAIAADASGHPHIVWVDWIGGTSEVYHITNDGTDWSSPQSVSGVSSYSMYPCIAADGVGGIHVVWRGYVAGAWSVFYRKYESGVWSDIEKISVAEAVPEAPSLAVDDSLKIHVVWSDYRHYNYEVFYTCFDGDSWSADSRLTDDPGVSENATVVADCYGVIHVFWDDDREGKPGIYQKSFDGVTWTADQYLVSPIGNAYSPSAIPGDGGNLHLAWWDEQGATLEVYYMEFNGSSWGSPELLSTGTSREPHIATDAAGNPHVAWIDSRMGRYQMFWTARLDLSEPAIVSITPNSALSHSEVHITDLAGSGFFFGATVWLGRPGEVDIAATNVVVESPESISCDFDLYYVADGLWDVVLESIDGRRDTLVDGFEVIGLPPPEIMSLYPNKCPAYDGIHVSSLVGTGFRDETKVVLVTAGESAVEAFNVVAESPYAITCDVSFGCAVPGWRDVAVRNPDGRADTLFSGFEVLPGVWSEDLRLTNAPGRSRPSQPNARCIAVDDEGKIHAVWYDLRDGDTEIFYRACEAEVWGPEEQLTTDGVASDCPALALDSAGHPHVVWADYRHGNYEIYYKYHDGSSWSADERLTDATGDSEYPSIAIGPSGNIYVVWQDDRGTTSRIYIRIHDGSGWLPEEKLQPYEFGCLTPAVGVDSSECVHVVWSSDGDQLRYKRLVGTTWSDTETIVDNYHVYGPSLAVDSNDMLHVAWHDERNWDGWGYDIFYRRFNGLAWDPEVAIIQQLDDQFLCSVAVDESGNVHVVWTHQRSTFEDIFYMAFDGETRGFAIRLTDAPRESRNPSLAVGPDGGLHTIWWDGRDWNGEIYYKRRDPLHLAAVSDRDEGKGEALVEDLTVSPNPISRSARVRFRVPYKAVVSLSVYDVLGRSVWRRLPEIMDPGIHSLTWSPNVDSDSRVAPGIYLLSLTIGEVNTRRKVVVVR